MNSSSAATIASKNTRKRKQRSDTYGVVSILPEIPGIPMEVLPLHMHAIQVATQWFRNQQESCVVVLPLEHSSKQNDSMGSAASVMDAIWHRMDDSSQQQQQQQQTRELQRKTQAINNWLQAIRRFCSNESSLLSVERSVPVACLRHLLEPNENEQQSFAMLRAKTHLAGHLLEKSADARRWFIEYNNRCNNPVLMIQRWMDRVLMENDGDGRDNRLRALWQQESFLLLQHLQNKFGHYYPTLSTAVQRFQQLRPEITSQSPDDSIMAGTVIASSTMNMVERRKIRDLAMQHAKQEYQRVQKLLNQAYNCIDILFPRVTHDIITDTEKDNILDDNNHDDSDEDSIDWEDGCKQNDASQTSRCDHDEAVEHTLAAMEFAGTLKNGELEINFTEDTKPVTMDGEKQSDAVLLQARERFESVVNKLAKKHMPRLSSWVDALHQADSLVEVQPRKKMLAASAVIVGEAQQAPATLERMSANQAQERAIISKQLVDLKQQVASLLSSAKRMGLDLKVDSLNHGVSPQTRASRVVRERLVNISPRRQPIASLQNRTRKTHHSSSRIQIKYRKNH